MNKMISLRKEFNLRKFYDIISWPIVIHYSGNYNSQRRGDEEIVQLQATMKLGPPEFDI
jgi:hypothetical protein